MGLLSRIFGKDVSREQQPSAGVVKTTEVTKKEDKPVADKITAGHVHMSGCTGCLVAVADNYGGLLTLLDKYVDYVYDLTLADVRHIPKMDVALVEGSVCINDKISVEEIKQTREKSAIVVAVGGCACYGNITRFARGGQQNQPKHEAFLPIGDLINVDVYIPGCPPRPDAFMEGLLLLRDMIGKERRPLSWVAGSQTVDQPVPPCMRDRKRQERMKATVLPSPDEVK